MSPLLPSLGFLLLLAASLALKFVAQPETVPVDAGADGTVLAFLSSHDFALSDPDTGDAHWLVATRPDCRIEITDVSPQGWHRSMVEEHAAGHRVAYAFAGSLYERQPVARTMTDHYWRRLQRYFGVARPARPIRAVVLSPDCPMEISHDPGLARLGG